MSNYKVSVIVPVYNMELYLKECLDSILSQTLSEIEVICIDDGSTDNTTKILEEYSSEFSNIVVLHQNRKGAGMARNAGIRIAEGEFVAFVDSDDYYPSRDVLECLYDVAKQNGVEMAAGSSFRVVNGIKAYSDNKKLRFYGENKMIYSNEYQCPYGYTRFIYNTSFIRENNLYFPDLVRFQDPPFQLNALVKAEKFVAISKEVYAYREFDKKIEFTSFRVINDIAKGFFMLMQLARDNSLLELQNELIESNLGYEDAMLMHVINGNSELYETITAISQFILDKEKKHNYEDYWSMESIANRYDECLTYAQYIKEIICNYNKVIIYGAGVFGKQLYDFIERIEEVEFCGFAVTKENNLGTARGFNVVPLKNYVRENRDALVLIAIKEDIDNEMENYAKGLGFNNTFVVNRRIGCVGIGQITNGRFAFDN